MEKENKLLRKVGTGNPFRVPDRYFEDFSRELMARLPEKEAPQPLPELTLWQRVKPWVYMTAMFCGLMCSFRMLVGNQDKETFSLTPVETENIAEEDWQDIINRSMIDDYSLYQYLTEAETDFYR